MALIKNIGVGDKLIFDLADVAGNTKSISIFFTEKSGRGVTLEIVVDKAINISTISSQKIWFGLPKVQGSKSA